MSRLNAFFTNPAAPSAQTASPVQPGAMNPQQGMPSQQFGQVQQPQVQPQNPAQPRKPVTQGPLTGLRSGQLVRFKYLLAKNDPRPLIIVSRQDPSHRLLKGVNLHYLTFPYIQRLLYTAGANPAAANYNIKADPYIMDAFRSYSWAGIDQSSIEIFDTSFITQMINVSRTMDPMALRSMRSQIDQQINARVAQPQAVPTGPMPMGVPQQPQSQQLQQPNPTGIQ